MIPQRGCEQMMGLIQFCDDAVQNFRPLAPRGIFCVTASFPPKSLRPTVANRRGRLFDFVTGITGLLQKHQILAPRKAPKRQQARGLWSKFSPQQEGGGGGMEGGTCRRSYCATSESGLPGIGRKALPLPLWLASPLSSSLTSVQSDLCLFKIQPPLADSAPAVSHPPELKTPQSYFQLWSGWGGSQSSL